MYKVPAGSLNGQIRVLVNAGLKEQEAIDNAKQIGQMKLQSGQIQGSQYLTLLDMDNVHEMREYFAEQEE